jgi:hypothetical protein
MSRVVMLSPVVVGCVLSRGGGRALVDLGAGLEVVLDGHDLSLREEVVASYVAFLRALSVQLTDATLCFFFSAVISTTRIAAY